jgi:Fe-S oxidoreductase
MLFFSRNRLLENLMIMQFDPFIIPFNIGLYFILIYCVLRFFGWFRELPRTDKLRLQRGFFGKPFVQSLKEIFMESLLHRKIFKINPRLGYMHMSLAFGWFLLIVFGTLEADIFGLKHLNAPYKAIFFKFFNPEHGISGFEAVYSFWMDFILAVILSGLILAIAKRLTPKVVGLGKTTKLKALDKVALISLWLIFPSRLLAESFTSGAYGSGSFLTGSLGSWLATFLPAQQLAYPFWWLYSIALGTFFILLPRTRYMHIPTEILLIFMRNSGISTSDKWGSYAEVEINACSSCGICIDQCQLSSSTGISDVQSTYLIKGIRNGIDVFNTAHNCLMCGRCEEKCPVGLELGSIRMIQRREGEAIKDIKNIWKSFNKTRQNIVPEKKVGPVCYDYLEPGQYKKADVLYFAGCMTHLTPGIKNSFISILKEAGVNYYFMDENGGACCGRPLMLAGQEKEARELINFNSQIIWKSGAHTIVTSCPICYKVFKESYYLDVEILHHSQYIKRLIDEGAIRLNYTNKKVVYHDPCELGRGSGIYNEPREVLKHVTNLEKSNAERESALCCGGSLANIILSQQQRSKIARDVVSELTVNNPEILATACPLCKKTLSNASGTKVLDISEIVADSLTKNIVPALSGSMKTIKEPATLMD